jgi:hypothetical protein
MRDKFHLRWQVPLDKLVNLSSWLDKLTCHPALLPLFKSLDKLYLVKSPCQVNLSSQLDKSSYQHKCRTLNNPLKWVLSISRDYWFYFEKVPQNSNSERARRIERLFPRANLVLRPAWHCDSFVIIRFFLTLGSIRQSNTHPRRTEMKRPMPSTSLARVTVCLEGVWKFLFVEKLSGPHSTTFSPTFPSPPKWNHLELTRWFRSTLWLLC